MTPEGEVKAEITKALKQMGFRVYRIQCGMWKVKGGWMHGAEDGTADLQVPVMLSGVAKAILWIETKAQGGKLREAQRLFGKNLPQGEYYLPAKSLDEVLEWLKKHQARA